MAYEALRFIRPFVKVSSAVAPRLTGNLAFRLFCRPPRIGGLNRTQKRMVESAQVKLSAATTERLAFPGGDIQTYRFKTTETTSRGTILLLHGWTGRAAFMSAFIEPLRAAGFDVTTVDLPGHGESSGRVLHIPLAIAALHAVYHRYGPWHGIVAHSFGGAVAASLVSGAVANFPALPVKRMVLIGTPHSMSEIFTWFGTTLGLTKNGQHWLNDNVKRLAGRGLETFEGRQQLREAAIPTLLLHAPDDKEAAFSGAEVLATAGHHVTLRPMPGLGHRRILYARESIAATVSFLETGESAVSSDLGR